MIEILFRLYVNGHKEWHLVRLVRYCLCTLITDHSDPYNFFSSTSTYSDVSSFFRGPFLASFSLFSYFQWGFFIQLIVNKNCLWLDPIDRSLVLEATALPLSHNHSQDSVTRFGKIPPLWHYVKKTLAKGSFSIWKHFQIFLVNAICYLANLPCCKWLRIEQAIYPSGHTDNGCWYLLK